MHVACTRCLVDDAEVGLDDLMRPIKDFIKVDVFEATTIVLSVLEMSKVEAARAKREAKGQSPAGRAKIGLGGAIGGEPSGDSLSSPTAATSGGSRRGSRTVTAQFRELNMEAAFAFDAFDKVEADRA
jgi:hypothetical protein